MVGASEVRDVRRAGMGASIFDNDCPFGYVKFDYVAIMRRFCGGMGCFGTLWGCFGALCGGYGALWGVLGRFLGIHCRF